MYTCYIFIMMHQTPCTDIHMYIHTYIERISLTALVLPRLANISASELKVYRRACLVSVRGCTLEPRREEISLPCLQPPFTTERSRTRFLSRYFYRRSGPVVIYRQRVSTTFWIASKKKKKKFSSPFFFLLRRHAVIYVHWRTSRDATKDSILRPSAALSLYLDKRCWGIYEANTTNFFLSRTRTNLLARAKDE